MMLFHFGIRKNEIDTFIAQAGRLSEGDIIPITENDSWENWGEALLISDVDVARHVTISTMKPLLMRDLIMELRNFLVPLEDEDRRGICVLATEATDIHQIFPEFTLRGTVIPLLED